MKFDNFDIIWIEICTYQAESGVPNHKHDFFHYIYVDSGEGEITVGEESHRLQSGYIYPIPPDTEHTFHNSGEEPLRTLELKFSMTDGDSAVSSLPYCMDVSGYHIKSCLLSLYRETRSKQSKSATVTELQFRLLLAYLMRAGENIKKGSSLNEHKKSSSGDMERVITYICENIAEDITLDMLADMVGFEKNYFLRKFKRHTGKTPLAFIVDKRLEKAKELLRFSDMNITQIAAATGFKSVHYFSKVFFDNMNVRPSEWRAEQ